MSALNLTSYSGLQATVAAYLNRRDLTDQIPTFIRLAEAKFNRELRVNQMQAIREGTSYSNLDEDDEMIPVPDDYLATYSLELKSPQSGAWSAPLRFMSDEEARTIRAQTNNAGGPLRGYTIFGQEFHLVPPQTGTITFRLRYYGAIKPLSDAAPDNWLLWQSPDLYVYSACLEATPYLKADERLPVWAALRTQIIDAMHLESERALKPQAALSSTRRTFG